jgi:SAM-dependent methyltransferase
MIGTSFCFQRKGVASQGATSAFARALLGAGLDVIAVEPQAQLREILAASVGVERVLDGLAEEIPLPNSSVAAVTVADAFHWFDQVAALREIQRVLIAGGGLAVLRLCPTGMEPLGHMKSEP